MMTGAAALHVRQQRSFLAAPEKQALVWMAQRLPNWVHPDHLTLLALAAMLSAGVGYGLASRNRLALVIAVLGLAVNWLGDSLDGTLARVRDRQRPKYGFYADHALDLFSSLFLLGGLALSGYMSPLIALGLLAAYFMVNAEEFLATHVRRVFRLSFFGFGPTELRIILAVGTLYVLLVDRWVDWGTLGVFRLFDVGGIVAIAGLAVKIVVSVASNAHALYLDERLP